MITLTQPQPQPQPQPQLRILREACSPGGAKRNSRYYISLQKLKKAGLVVLDVEVRPDALRGRHTQLWTAFVTDAGKQFLREV